MHETTRIETEQQKACPERTRSRRPRAESRGAYPGLRVRREGDAVVVHIPMRFYRRNGRNMIVAEGDAEAMPLSSPLPCL